MVASRTNCSHEGRNIGPRDSKSLFFNPRKKICANQFVKVSYDASSTAVLSLLLITWKEELTRSSRNCEWNFKVFGVGNREENFK